MRFTRRTQSAQERRRVLPALPEGGGAASRGRSIERGAAHSRHGPFGNGYQRKAARPSRSAGTLEIVRDE